MAFNTSTGAAGWRTPPGRFAVDPETDGVRHAELGDLYRPRYFNAGIAIHGSPSIPAQPASHGCARLHDDAVDHLWAQSWCPSGRPSGCTEPPGRAPTRRPEGPRERRQPALLAILAPFSAGQ